ncbi:MAG: hypothetical protein ACSW8H_00295 [bacterium]
MKYIAVFDIPDNYSIGMTIAKMAPKGKEVYNDEDFENVYAQVEPLSEEKAEVLDRFNAVERVISDIGLHCAYDMPSFWCNKGKDYAVIETKYHKGYMQALKDVEREVRKRFGFAESEHIPMPMPDVFA